MIFRKPFLGREDHSLARHAALAHALGDDLLGAVAFGGVDEVHAQLDGAANDRNRFLAAPPRPRAQPAVPAAAQAHLTDHHPSATEGNALHAWHLKRS